MATRERSYTVDDVWRLACAPENDAKKICLIDGELVITMSPGRIHGRLALRIGRFIADYADLHDLGEAAVEVGYHSPDDRRTLLMPDVAFESKARAEQPVDIGYVPFMPDLAVEFISPQCQDLKWICHGEQQICLGGKQSIFCLAAETRTRMTSLPVGPMRLKSEYGLMTL